MSDTGYSKLKPCRLHVLYFFIVWWTPAVLEDIFGFRGGFIGGIFQLSVFALAGLFLLGSFLKSKNGYIFALFFFMTFLSFLRVLALTGTGPETRKVPDPMGIFIFLISLLVILFTTVRFPAGFTWYRYLPLFLELAAKQVMHNADGYTNRPYPMGKGRYKKEEITAFARYMHKNLIASAYFEDDRTVLVFSNGIFQYIPFLKPRLTGSTYVSFHDEGTVSVNFARGDYKKYWDEATFDQLCSSFGNIVIDFFTAFNDGKGNDFLESMTKEGMEIRRPVLTPTGDPGSKMGRTGKIDTARVILSGIFALFVFMTVEGIVEGGYYNMFDPHGLEMWQALALRLGSVGKILNLSMAVVLFVISMWMYAAFIPRFGAGAKNVLITCLIFLGLAYLRVLNLMNMGFISSMSTGMLVSDVIFNLIEVPVSIFAGAWLYREE